MRPLTVKELIKALKVLDPNATVVFNIMQHNRITGKQLTINSHAEPNGRQLMVDDSYGGACIWLYLPSPAIIHSWPKDHP